MVLRDFLTGKLSYFWTDFGGWIGVYLAGTIILLLVGRRFIFWRPQIHMGKVVIGNLSVLAILLLYALFGLEFYYRYIFDETDNFFAIKTAKRWYERHVVYNSWTFRDEHWPWDKDPEQPWVAILGDSFVFGYGIKDVNQRVDEVLEDKIRSVCGKARVHAVAREGMDTVEELKFFRQYVAPSHHEVVVLGYYINDISGDDTRKNLPWYQGIAALYEKPVLGFLLQHSYAIEYMVVHLALRFDPQTRLGIEYYANLHRDPVVWKRHQRTFLELMNETRKANRRLMVMIFPVMHVLGPDYPYKDVHRQLSDFWTKHGVPVVDLEPIYSQEGTDALIVSNRDFHANERGHALAANALFEQIREEGWFPCLSFEL